jgi:hypothetical protein
LSQPLKTSESIEILKRKLRVVPVRNTDIIQIEAVDTNPEEAATLANAVVAAYRDYRSQIRARKIADALPVLQRAYDENRREILELQTEIAGLSRAQNAADTNRIADANKRLEERQQISVSLLFKRLGHQTDLALPATDMVRIIDPAIPPRHPENPNFRLNLTVAFLVGGLPGCSWPPPFICSSGAVTVGNTSSPTTPFPAGPRRRPQPCRPGRRLHHRLPLRHPDHSFYGHPDSPDHSPRLFRRPLH